MLNSLNGIKMKVINMVLISVISVRIYCDDNNNDINNNDDIYY